MLGIKLLNQSKKADGKQLPSRGHVGRIIRLKASSEKPDHVHVEKWGLDGWTLLWDTVTIERLVEAFGWPVGLARDRFEMAGHAETAVSQSAEEREIPSAKVKFNFNSLKAEFSQFQKAKSLPGNFPEFWSALTNLMFEEPQEIDKIRKLYGRVLDKIMAIF